MEPRTENAGWRSVPQFGGWDQKGEVSPNYSMVFSQARANRKQAKREVRPLSLGNEADMIARQTHHAPAPGPHQPVQHHDHDDDDSHMRKKTFLTFCCVRPY